MIEQVSKSHTVWWSPVPGLNVGQIVDDGWRDDAVGGELRVQRLSIGICQASEYARERRYRAIYLGDGVELGSR